VGRSAPAETLTNLMSTFRPQKREVRGSLDLAIPAIDRAVATDEQYLPVPDRIETRHLEDTNEASRASPWLAAFECRQREDTHLSIVLYEFGQRGHRETGGALGGDLRGGDGRGGGLRVHRGCCAARAFTRHRVSVDEVQRLSTLRHGLLCGGDENGINGW
jgi:hypothetical protein